MKSLVITFPISQISEALDHIAFFVVAAGCYIDKEITPSYFHNI